MTDRMIPVPESALRAVAGLTGIDSRIDTLVACLPEPEPTFTDAEALVFYRAVWPESAYPDDDAIMQARIYLTRLAKAGWTAPKALCPPPSPALVELVEAAKGVNALLTGGRLDRLRAAVAAYEREEG